LEKSHQTAAGMASIFPKRFCSNSLTHPSYFYFGFRVKRAIRAWHRMMKDFEE
jgi:hypothetical protein